MKLTQVPWLHRLMVTNPVLRRLAPSTTAPILQVTGEKIKQRQESSVKKQDMLSAFVEAGKVHSEQLPLYVAATYPVVPRRLKV